MILDVNNITAKMNLTLGKDDPDPLSVRQISWTLFVVDKTKSNSP